MSRAVNSLRTFGEFALDLDQRILWVRGVPADLPSKAVELLCVLVESGGEVVSKNDLLDRVWADSFVEEGVLTQNVYQLRKAFKAAGIDEELIQTVPRRGYRFAGNADTPFRNEITIERETFEQAYITETEYDDASLPSIRPVIGEAASDSSLRRRSVILAAAVLFAAIGAGAFGAWTLIGDPVGQTAPVAASGVEYERLTPSARALYVGLSPDDSNAAYVMHTADAKYSLVLVHLSSGSETVIIQPQEKHLFNIQFAPDGSHIYYGATPDGGDLGVYRIPIYGGTPQLITRRPVHHFSISPDGTQMAFYRRAPEERAQYLDVCGIERPDECRSVARMADGSGFKIWGTSPHWSADGLRLLTATIKRETPDSPARETLSEIDLATGAVREVPTPSVAAVHQAYWSESAGGIFAMVREKRGEPVQLWFIDAGGKASRVTNDNDDYREFRPASDGRFLVASTWKKAENLYLVSVDEPSNVTQLTFDNSANNGAWGLGWMPDGNSLLFTRAEGHLTGNLWRMALDTGQTEQITFDKGAMVYRPVVTPDGNRIFFTSDRGGRPQIWQMNSDGSGLQIAVESRSADPAVSADGKWLYYTGGGLWRRPIDGGESVPLTRYEAGEMRTSPADAAKFAAFYIDHDAAVPVWGVGIFDANAPSAAPVRIPHAATVAVWKPDGTGLYLVDRGETVSNIWFAPADGGEARRITNFTDQKISNLAVSPDGKTFAVSRGAAINNLVKITLDR